MRKINTIFRVLAVAALVCVLGPFAISIILEKQKAKKEEK